MILMLNFKGEEWMMEDYQNYQDVIKYIGQNLKIKQGDYSMSYKDQFDDDITIAQDSDFLAMKDYLNDKNQVTIFIKLEKIVNAQNKDQKKNIQNFQIQPEKEKQANVIEYTRKKIFGDFNKIEKQKNNQLLPQQLPSKQQQKVELKNVINEIYDKNNNFQKQQLQENQITEQIQQKQCVGQKNQQGWMKHKGACHGKWKQKMQQKIAKLVDQRIQNMLPCIIKRVQDTLQTKQQKPIKHQQITHNIKCNGCGSETINGIRYKCTQCPSFNFCQKCQMDIDHGHNMIKMKYIDQEKKEEEGTINNCHFWMKGHGHRHGHGHGYGHGQKHGFWHPRLWTTDKCYRMCKCFGGQPKNYELFVKTNFYLRFDQLLKLYLTQNPNVKIGEQDNENKKQKCQKLLFYFNQPSQKYGEIVNKYPFANLRELIEIIEATTNHGDQKF